MNDHDDSEKSRLERVRVGAAACPICNATISNSPDSARYRPFCSRRCADVDLHRWLGGVYRMPTNEVPDPDLLEAELRIGQAGDQQQNEED